ncbi:glycosyltransferase [Enterococcus avium]|nr:glycosyltransferase [Enterococcus avium]
MNKLLVVSNYYFPIQIGGAEISTQILVEELARNYEILVVTSNDKEQEITKDIVNNVRVYRVPINNFYWPAIKKDRNSISKFFWHIREIFGNGVSKEFQRIVNDFNPEIILFQNVTGLGTKIFTVKTGAKKIFTMRDYMLINPTRSRTFNKFAKSKNIKRTRNLNGVVGISKYILRNYRENGFFNGIDSEVIGNVVVSKLQRKKLEKLSNKKLKVGFFGQVAEIKGIVEFLEGASSLIGNEIDNIVVVGDGPLRDVLKEKYKQNNAISFIGRKNITAVYSIMSKLDLVVVPSKWEEPFGRVVIEAYSQGAIVISSNMGGLSEILLDKNLLLNDITSEEISNKIKYVYVNNYDLKKYVDYSREFKKNNYRYQELIGKQLS